MPWKLHLVRDFILGGLSVAFVSYLANHVRPSLAGFVTGIPVGLLLIYFVNDYQKSLKYTSAHTMSAVVMTAVTILFYYLYVILKKDKMTTLSYSFFLWILLVSTIWFYHEG
jgi:hypothetical protein